MSIKVKSRILAFGLVILLSIPLTAKADIITNWESILNTCEPVWDWAYEN